MMQMDSMADGSSVNPVLGFDVGCKLRNIVVINHHSEMSIVYGYHTANTLIHDDYYTFK